MVWARTWVVRGGVAAAAAVLGAGVAWGVDDHGRSLAAAAPEGATAEVPTTTEPPSVEEVTATIEVEAGVTPGQVVACNTAGGQATGWYPAAGNCPPEELGVIGDGVSYGIVVENTGDQVVTGIPLTYRFVTDDGTVVPEPATPFSDSDLSSDEARITLWPGQRFGVGGMTYREGPGATRIEVEVGEPASWMPEMAGEAAHGPVSGDDPVEITGIEVGYGDDNEPVVHFDARLTEAVVDVLEAAGQPPEVERPFAYAIFRDRSGRVIGGADGWLDVSIGADEPVACEVALDDPLEVPGIDPGQVEIFISAFAV
jgi:hypothetical protein